MLNNDDERLAYEVERAFNLLPEVNSFELRVSVDRGRARIQGVVDREAEREAALAAARAIPGIVAVDDSVTVETAASSGNSKAAGNT
jgi:osmotically-inducible protein OsmY